MGIDALRAALEREGRARSAAVLEDARARARALREAAASAAAARRLRALHEKEVALRRDAAARLAAARGAARQRVLEARAALLDRVFAAAREALPAALETPAARQLLVDLAEQALRYMPPGAVVIECSSGIAPFLERALAQRDGVQVAPDPALGAGFRARSGSGALVVDATLASLLELRRPALAIEVLGRLARTEAT